MVSLRSAALVLCTALIRPPVSQRQEPQKERSWRLGFGIAGASTPDLHLRSELDRRSAWDANHGAVDEVRR